MSCQSYPALVGGLCRRTAAASSACWISAAGRANSTAVLRERYPHAEILGVDSSPDMIEAARKAYPDIDFQLCDVSTHR